MFYDPLECRPFYKDKDAPIWYGRVENLSAANQKVYVYGFVTSAPTEDLEPSEILTIEISMQMRGKNSKDEYWNYLNEDEPYQTHTFNCDGADELCTYWPVGFLPIIEYDMYDVAILVKPNAQMTELERTSVNFHIAYVNPAFTSYQIGFRTFFTLASMVIFCFYSNRLLCRVPVNL